MEILIGLGLALALLYAWLRAWWFARVVVFLGLAGVLGFAGAAGGSQLGQQWAQITQSAQIWPSGMPWPVEETAPDAIREHRALTADEARRTLAAVDAAAQRPSWAVPLSPRAFLWLGACAGVLLAWPLASLPIYCRRYQERRVRPGAITPSRAIR
jgi:hypothetical protein